MRTTVTQADGTKEGPSIYATPNSLAGPRTAAPTVSEHLDAYEAAEPLIMQEFDPVTEQRVMMLAAVVLGVVVALALGLILVALGVVA